MIRTEYKAPDGRLYQVLVPEHDVEHPERGVRIGPPELDDLNLPFDTMIRLHNSLYHRGILTRSDFDRERESALSALQAALAVDVESMRNVYVRLEAKPTRNNADNAIVTSEGVRIVSTSARVVPSRTTHR